MLTGYARYSISCSPIPPTVVQRWSAFPRSNGSAEAFLEQHRVREREDLDLSDVVAEERPLRPLDRARDVGRERTLDQLDAGVEVADEVADVVEHDRPVTLLVLKLVLTPLLIVGASLAGRRWGPAVSGWIVGMPLTSAPVSLFVALQHGKTFASHAAVGSIAGVIAECAMFIAWGLVAERGWAVGLLAGSAVFWAIALPARR